MLSRNDIIGMVSEVFIYIFEQIPIVIFIYNFALLHGIITSTNIQILLYE